MKRLGTKSWQYRYKNSDDKWAWIGIGPYPNVSAKLARQKVQEFNLAISKGEALKPKKLLVEKYKELESYYFKI